MGSESRPPHSPYPRPGSIGSSYARTHAWRSGYSVPIGGAPPLSEGGVVPALGREGGDRLVGGHGCCRHHAPPGGPAECIGDQPDRRSAYQAQQGLSRSSSPWPRHRVTTIDGHVARIDPSATAGRRPGRSRRRSSPRGAGGVPGGWRRPTPILPPSADRRRGRWQRWIPLRGGTSPPTDHRPATTTIWPAVRSDFSITVRNHIDTDRPTSAPSGKKPSYPVVGRWIQRRNSRSPWSSRRRQRTGLSTAWLSWQRIASIWSVRSTVTVASISSGSRPEKAEP